MLDQKTFLQGINYLKAIYLKWDFDINNDLSLKVWYKKFSALEDKEFMKLIEKYTDENSWPPQSPNDILSLIKTESNTGEAAWDLIEALAKQYPLNEYYKPKFYQELKKDDLAYNLFMKLDCEPIFLDHEEKFIYKAGNLMLAGFGKGYRRDKFIQWYNQMKQPSSLLMIGNSHLLLD